MSFESTKYLLLDFCWIENKSLDIKMLIIKKCGVSWDRYAKNAITFWDTTRVMVLDAQIEIINTQPTAKLDTILKVSYDVTISMSNLIGHNAMVSNLAKFHNTFYSRYSLKLLWILPQQMKHTTSLVCGETQACALCTLRLSMGSTFLKTSHLRFYPGA